MDSSTVVGILGGGQLGRMMLEAAHRLNVRCVVVDAPNCPAKQIDGGHDHIDASFRDENAIAELAKKSTVVTTEIEHINTDALESISSTVSVEPSYSTLRCIQDKYLQKQHLQTFHIALPDFCDAPDQAAVENAGQKFGYPFVLKSKTLAYDGRGNYVVRQPQDIPDGIKALGDRPLYVEKFVPFSMEIAVMVVRTLDGKVYAYPTTETIQRDNICHLVYAPARLPHHLQKRAQTLAMDAVRTFKGAGIYGVEMFVLQDGESVLLNEIAPRPHNSGHYTIEACPTSQFEAHIRAITGLPFTEANTHLSTATTHALMVNLLGGEDPCYVSRIAKRSLTIPGATLHLYGKGESRKGRKMGHITIIADSSQECERRYLSLIEEEEKVQVPSEPPMVGIIMGSDSDLSKMKDAAVILDQFKVPYEVTIVSAHRTPERMVSYARTAASRGLRVIIAGAGGAAHLPGMVAAMTPLPVIGVPVKGSSLDGVDSLHSIVQMPRGVPVATVAINNSTNAGLLACRILASFRPDLLHALEEYMDNMRDVVLEKADRLEQDGWKNYSV
ncbi:phosphoribosylaminoimidazole carboxylase Ade6 [Schizosaccharomyces octosporus yFS286]|uniref:Phosphoribosylaminoimidazole carboxylase n=1 Tax=Schizosaccharomyces octosporus (strain yFS286) TaxID=483514 RepID=S9RA41_SCHOY|nr:phosphoribosylaminoimidazole carboxylase Ade6 [Schizosaccharomyces octosporus yFS286]EPX70999.1 phosphoribosylaminoimidazole carboxylase Ade6 [Schizosaccharomyces octosporus yFS286]